MDATENVTEQIIRVKTEEKMGKGVFVYQGEMEVNMRLTDNESIFCQAIAMTSLLTVLSNEDFLHSDYYNNLQFSGNDENIKKILEVSGLGNPATMQMFLYSLLVMPKEILGKEYTAYSESGVGEVNELIFKLAEKVETTYPDVKGQKIDNWYRHIRNAVAHSKCSYCQKDNICYVSFYDENPRNKSQHCKITMKTQNVGVLLTMLQVQMMEFLNKKMRGK